MKNAASAALKPKRRTAMKSRGRRAIEGALIGALAAGIFILLSLANALEPIENRLWDMRAKRFAVPSPHTDDIRIVLLDQPTLDWAETELGVSWPWPREFYGSMVSFFTRANAKAVAFDVLYTENSFYGEEDDALFADAIRANGRFVAAMQLSADGGESVSWPAGLSLPAWRMAGDGGAAKDEGTAMFSIPAVSGSAKALGNVLSGTDADGMNRRLGLISRFDGSIVPSLGLAAYLVGTGATELRVSKGKLYAGNAAIPLDAKGRSILRFRGPSHTHTAFNAGAVLRSEQAIREGKAPELAPSEFAGKYVFFGFSAPGLLDLRPVPVDKAYPGVELHVTSLDDMLSGDGYRELPLPWALAMTMCLGMAAGALIRLSRAVQASVAVFALAIVLPVAMAWFATPLGFWVPVAMPFFAVLVSLIACFIVNYAGEGRQKRFIKDAFSQYLSPVVIERLVQNPDQLILGGEKRCLSILFSDIRGFTSISEHLDPVALTGLLNDYLSEVTDIIYRFGGTIDKYEGDAVIAFWNAPLDLSDHARKAVGAALQYQRTLSEIRPRLAETAGRDIYARIGLNSGDVVIGNMGSRQRFNYTFLGDAGNLASRLEGINKQFGTFIMVSENTKRLAGDDPEIVYRELSKVTVVGKKEPVTVYEPMYREDRESRAGVLDAFDRGLRLYYSGDFRKAYGTLEPICDRDAPAKSYCARLQALLAEKPAEWTGVWDITEK